MATLPPAPFSCVLVESAHEFSQPPSRILQLLDHQPTIMAWENGRPWEILFLFFFYSLMWVVPSMEILSHSPTPLPPCSCPPPSFWQSCSWSTMCCSWCSRLTAGPGPRVHAGVWSHRGGVLAGMTGKEACGVSVSCIWLGLPPIHSHLSVGNMWSWEATCNLWIMARVNSMNDLPRKSLWSLVPVGGPWAVMIECQRSVGVHLFWQPIFLSFSI